MELESKINEALAKYYQENESSYAGITKEEAEVINWLVIT